MLQPICNDKSRRTRPADCLSVEVTLTDDDLTGRNSKIKNGRRSVEPKGTAQMRIAPTFISLAVFFTLVHYVAGISIHIPHLPF